MTAIRATFSDFKLIKTRKVAVLCLEVPIEQANAALAALGGVPQFGEEQWVGVAPLTAEDAPAPAPKKPMTRAQWAGMLCEDRQFTIFLKERGNIPCAHPNNAAEFVREHCGVTSRSQIDSFQPAAAKWDTLHTEYDAWRGKIGRPE